METDERRKPPGFVYERHITLMAIGGVALALAWGGNNIIEMGKAMEARATVVALGVVQNEMTAIKVGHAFEREAVERRLSTLERQVDALRTRDRPYLPAPN